MLVYTRMKCVIQKELHPSLGQHISDAKLTAESEEKLIYILPLERTNKFPGNLPYDHIEYS